MAGAVVPTECRIGWGAIINTGLRGSRLPSGGLCACGAGSSSGRKRAGGRGRHRPNRSPTGYLQFLPSILPSLLFKNLLAVPEAELLFIGHPRRQRRKGLWWDIYCDPIIEEVVEPSGLSHPLLESPYLNRHRTPLVRRTYGTLMGLLCVLPCPVGERRGVLARSNSD